MTAHWRLSPIRVAAIVQCQKDKQMCRPQPHQYTIRPLESNKKSTETTKHISAYWTPMSPESGFSTPWPRNKGCWIKTHTLTLKWLNIIHNYAPTVDTLHYVLGIHVKLWKLNIENINCWLSGGSLCQCLADDKLASAVWECPLEPTGLYLSNAITWKVNLIRCHSCR